MPTSFSEWVRRKIANKKHLWDKNKDHKDPKSSRPILPLQRPRILTPSPSHESLVASAAPATTNSAFFRRLPFEVRRMILIEAFGNKIIHMDLYFADRLPPLRDRVDDPVYSCRHANFKKSWHYEKRKELDKWQWHGSVCHRAPPETLGMPMGAEPFEDSCQDGYSHWCDLWPGEKPGKCLIGVMGWLLSCRQGYAEGINVLYSTNTIHMNDHIMINDLEYLLLPQRLASITSVEMLWHTWGPRATEQEQNHDLRTIGDLMRTLPLTLRHLRRLYVSLRGLYLLHQELSYPDSYVLAASEANIMIPFDNMVRNLGPQLRECSIALQASLYEPRKYQATGESCLLPWKHYGEWEQLWRELPQIETGDDDGPAAHLPGY